MKVGKVFLKAGRLKRRMMDPNSENGNNYEKKDGPEKQKTFPEDWKTDVKIKRILFLKAGRKGKSFLEMKVYKRRMKGLKFRKIK